MRSRFDEGSESGYAYHGGMLNAGYITGFTRRTEGKTFLVQQTNDAKLGLPVYVEDRHVSSPQDTMPIKVVGRFLASLEDGERVLRFRAITLDRPSIRELPNRLAWEKTSPTGVMSESFKPFFDPQDNEEVSSPFYKGEKRNGRPCLNVARLAGFVESYAFKSGGGGNTNSDCLYIALRQTENPDESLPIRVYGRFNEAFKKQIQVALPIFIEGFYRVKKENKGTEEEPNWQSVPYIHCSNIKVATPLEIKVRPPWWNDMKDRLLNASKDRKAAAGKSKQAAKLLESTKKADEPPHPPSAPTEIVITDLE